MNAKGLARRRWLLGSATWGLAALACVGLARRGMAQAPLGRSDLNCSDVSGLSEQQVQTRRSLRYTDRSPNPKQLCKDCQHYQPDPDAQGCGGCTAVPGPIHPNGWCTAWLAAMTDAG